MPSDRDSMRAAWGIVSDAKVALIIYENETEWSFRTYLLEIASRYDRLFVYPVNPLAHKHLQLTCARILEHLKAIVVDSLEVEVAADEVILFRYVEELVASRRVSVRIVDTINRWLTRELSIGS